MHTEKLFMNHLTFQKARVIHQVKTNSAYIMTEIINLSSAGKLMHEIC